VIVAVLLVACSGKETTEPKNGGSAENGGNAGDPSNGDAGSGGSTGGVASGSGGTPASGAGTGNGGESNGGASSGGGTSGAGSGGEGELVSCDHREVLCKSVEPTCPDMQVARVEEGCWGPCTRIELCACSNADECPHEETYTCWSKEHCGPYVR
jgi:hypothetical protein